METRRFAMAATSARVLLVLASLSALAPARPVAAVERPEAGPLARWAGSYTYAGDAREREALVRAIEAATADMGPIARHIARSRLEGELRPDPRIVVRVAGSTIGIGALGNWRTTLDGPARVFEEDGDRYRVRHVREGGAIVQVVDGGSVRIEKAHALSEDGSRMRISVRFAHDRLGAPLLYELTYRRAR